MPTPLGTDPPSALAMRPPPRSPARSTPMRPAANWLHQPYNTFCTPRPLQRVQHQNTAKDVQYDTVGPTRVCFLECSLCVSFFVIKCQSLFCVIYGIQQTALFPTMINIQRKDTSQIHCDSFAVLRTGVAVTEVTEDRND